MAVGLVHDLAVGVHPDGADAWALQDVPRRGHVGRRARRTPSTRAARTGACRPGAPTRWPPPATPRTAELLRAAAPARGRAAHRPRDGPVPALVGAARAAADRRARTSATTPRRCSACSRWRRTGPGAVVIGEDLGTVEPGVREELTARGVLGTSVLWFERDWEGDGRAPCRPSAGARTAWPPLTTHDLPSTAARLTGEHVELRHRLGPADPPAGRGAGRGRGRAWRSGWPSSPGSGCCRRAPGDEEARGRGASTGFLLRTPARMVGVWLPDAVGDRAPAEPARHLGPVPELAAARSPTPTGRPLTLEELAASPRLHGADARSRPGRAAARGRRADPYGTPGARPRVGVRYVGNVDKKNALRAGAVPQPADADDADVVARLRADPRRRRRPGLRPERRPDARPVRGASRSRCSRSSPVWSCSRRSARARSSSRHPGPPASPRRRRGSSSWVPVRGQRPPVWSSALGEPLLTLRTSLVDCVGQPEGDVLTAGRRGSSPCRGRRRPATCGLAIEVRPG